MGGWDAYRPAPISFVLKHLGARRTGVGRSSSSFRRRRRPAAHPPLRPSVPNRPKQMTARIERNRAKRAARRAAGLCPICGQAPEVGFVVCQPCRQRRAEGKKRHIQKLGPRGFTLRKHGLNPEVFHSLFEAQKGRCAICEKAITEERGERGKENKAAMIDHDHVTGQVRGLLCLRCNVALGLFDDSPERLDAAIRYLARDYAHMPVSRLAA